MEIPHIFHVKNIQLLAQVDEIRRTDRHFKDIWVFDLNFVEYEKNLSYFSGLSKISM